MTTCAGEATLLSARRKAELFHILVQLVLALYARVLVSEQSPMAPYIDR